MGLPELAVAVLAALLSGAALRRLALGYARPAWRPRVLTRGEAALVAAVGDAVFPAGGPVAPSGSEARIPQWVDGYLEVVPSRVRRLMRLLLLLVEHATLVFAAPGRGGRRRFSALSPEQQAHVLESWRSSRLFVRRLVFTSLRAIMTMGYFASPRVLRQLKLAPLRIATPVLEADLLYPPVGQPRAAIRWTRADLTPPSSGVPLDPDGPIDSAYAASGPDEAGAAAP